MVPPVPLWGCVPTIDGCGQAVAGGFTRPRKVRTRKDTAVGNPHQPAAGLGKVPQRTDRLRSPGSGGKGETVR
jgi:hypothetical protein